MIQLSKIMHIDLSDYDESMLDIATDITHETGIGLTELKSSSRDPDIVNARQMFIRRATKNFKPKKIAAFLNMDRTSIYHHLERERIWLYK